MALNSIVVTVGQHFQDGGLNNLGYNTTAGAASSALPATLKTDNAADATALAAVVAAQATVAANVATLVADGATPTQAHVTTLNTNWGTLNTAINTEGVTQAAVNADVNGLAGGNVVITFDTGVVTTRAQLLAALRAALTLINGSSILS